MCDDTDHTWKSFCKNIVHKQVDNILCYPYKFTKLVNIQRIVVGVKQEGVISASKCIYHNRGIYLFREKTKLKEDIFSTKAVSFEPGDWLNTLLFLTAQVKHLLNKDLSCQPLILEFAGRWHKLPKPHPYSAAKARKVKIYCAKDIEWSTGFMQVYRRFWNRKAEEICVNKAWHLSKQVRSKEQLTLCGPLRKPSILDRK